MIPAVAAIAWYVTDREQRELKLKKSKAIRDSVKRTLKGKE